MRILMIVICLLNATTVLATDLTIEEVKTIADTSKSPTEFFEYLQSKPEEKYRRFLDAEHLSGKGITPIFKSRSSQQSAVSFSHPRIISFNGNLLFAVVGDPSQKKTFNEIEVVEVKQDHSLSPHRFDFQKSGEERHDKAPTTCAECHGEYFTFIWGKAGVSPGSYDQGYFYGKVKDHYKSFAANAANLPRYKPFLKGIKEFDVHNEVKDAPGVDPKFAHPGTYEAYWESNLNNFLLEKNNERVGQQLHSKHLEKYHWAILGALMDCDNLLDFLPKAVSEAHTKKIGRGISELVASTQKSIDEELDALFASNNELEKKFPGYSIKRSREDLLERIISASQMGKLRFIVEGHENKTPIPIRYWAIRSQPMVASYALQKIGCMFSECEKDPLLKKNFRILASGDHSLPVTENQMTMTDQEVADLKREYCKVLAVKSMSVFEPGEPRKKIQPSKSRKRDQKINFDATHMD
jgi:hypothetical protein